MVSQDHLPASHSRTCTLDDSCRSKRGLLLLRLLLHLRRPAGASWYPWAPTLSSARIPRSLAINHLFHAKIHFVASVEKKKISSKFGIPVGNSSLRQDEKCLELRPADSTSHLQPNRIAFGFVNTKLVPSGRKGDQRVKYLRATP